MQVIRERMSGGGGAVNGHGQIDVEVKRRVEAEEVLKTLTQQHER